jgi:NhaP-type Na+/H+ or K+/H+ antiporter
MNAVISRCFTCFLIFVPVVYATGFEEEDVLLGLFFSLFLGVVFTYLISRFLTELPYTVAVFTFGVIIAVVVVHANEHDLFKISILELEKFNGHLILYLFLPALLFGEAMSLNFYRLKENIGASLIMAGPSAVVSAVVTAIFVHYVLPYDWGWELSFMFGAITCATDPVGKGVCLFLSFLSFLSFSFSFSTPPCLL